MEEFTPFSHYLSENEHNMTCYEVITINYAILCQILSSTPHVQLCLLNEDHCLENQKSITSFRHQKNDKGHLFTYYENSLFKGRFIQDILDHIRKLEV